MFVGIIKVLILVSATDNDQQSYISDLRKRLNACVLARSGHFAHIV